MVKNLPANAGDASLIPGLGRSPGGGNGNPLQYSCLEDSMDRGAWRATLHGVTKSWTQLSTHTFTLLLRTQHFHFRGPTWVQSLVGKLRSHKLCGWPKKIKIKKKKWNFNEQHLKAAHWHLSVPGRNSKTLKGKHYTLLFPTGNFFPK